MIWSHGGAKSTTGTMSAHVRLQVTKTLIQDHLNKERVLFYVAESWGLGRIQTWLIQGLNDMTRSPASSCLSSVLSLVLASSSVRWQDQLRQFKASPPDLIAGSTQDFSLPVLSSRSKKTFSRSFFMYFLCVLLVQMWGTFPIPEPVTGRRTRFI